jgi:adenylate cyclase
VNVAALIAAPIFAPNSNRVIGVVYGSRDTIDDGEHRTITKLEADLVEVLAASVSSGLARQQQESEATRRKIQFEQFFSTELAIELDRNPDLLSGTIREVTMLFSDIRRFSRLAETLAPQEFCSVIRSVMDRLTDRIREYGGTVVDYIGDGILAVWNAPVDQADHAELACRAALAMLEEIPKINAQWNNVLPWPIQVGIGINTGPATVGNVGSSHRFKYGVLGPSVNLASRTEGATKQFGVPILITGSTCERIPKSFAVRRLCNVRVVGIENPSSFYQLQDTNVSKEWRAFRNAYETVLEYYESGNWVAASEAIAPIISQQNAQRDIPSLTLISRIVDCLRSPPKRFDPIWDLQVK